MDVVQSDINLYLEINTFILHLFQFRKHQQIHEICHQSFIPYTSNHLLYPYIFHPLRISLFVENRSVDRIASNAFHGNEEVEKRRQRKRHQYF